MAVEKCSQCGCQHRKNNTQMGVDQAKEGHCLEGCNETGFQRKQQGDQYKPEDCGRKFEFKENNGIGCQYRKQRCQHCDTDCDNQGVEQHCHRRDLIGKSRLKPQYAAIVFEPMIAET